MCLEKIIDILNSQLLECDNSCLNSTEILVLRGIWNNQTYKKIAQQEGYSTSYFANIVAPELCRRLSTLTRKQVTKKNCRAILKSYIAAQNPSVETLPTQSSGNLSQGIQEYSSPSYPCGSIPLNSPFYLKHPTLETKIIKEIKSGGGLVRIKAPQEMGKTSLLLRILDTCKQQLGYQTISLNFQKADQFILQDINRFLRWLCINCARQLGLQPKLDEYWDEAIGSKMSWTIYFEDYILAEIDSPIVLAFDEVNQVFEHPQVAEDFLPLLRSCYEEAKQLRKDSGQSDRQLIKHQLRASAN